MNYVLRIHFEKSFVEKTLPNINNSSISYFIKSNESGFDQDFLIKINVFDGVWSLLLDETVYIDEQEKGEYAFKDNDLIHAHFHKNNFNITFNVINDSYLQFEKFQITNEIIKIGRMDDNQIVFNDDNVSGHHAELIYENGSFGIYDKGRNGTYVNGVRVGEYGKPQFKELFFGDEIYIMGLKIIYLVDCIAINVNYLNNISISLNKVQRNVISLLDVVSKKYPDIYERSPRKINKLKTEPISIDQPPALNKTKKQPLLLTIGPSLTMVIPMAVGVLFTQWSYSQSGTGVNNAFMYMGIITSVTSAIIGIFWALINLRYSDKQAKETEKNRDEYYSNYIKNIKSDLEDRNDYNLKALNNKYPTSNECLKMIEEKSHRIWENNYKHEDFLEVRIGTGIVKNPININAGNDHFSMVSDKLKEMPRKICEEYSDLSNSPVVIDLKKAKLLGVVGDKKYEIIKTIVSQLCFRYTYSEVKIAFLFDGQDDLIEELKWIPHVWSEDHKIRLIGNSIAEHSDILYYVNTRIKNRIENEKSSIIPQYVVFAIAESVLNDGFLIKEVSSSNLGLTLIVISDNVENLPNECNEVLDDTYSRGYIFLDEKEEGNSSFNFDYVDNDLFKKSLKELSNYRINEKTKLGSIPDSVTYLEMINENNMNDYNVYRKWLENRTYESMKALIGIKSGNQPIYLDINEKAYGPHGLVAGTTGSGKSELLQTYILSLALNYHPYEVSFILIDYKGGGMAYSFEKLPHTVGVITNLGGNQTQRALTSINSEIKRRQKIFSSYHVKHIDEYIKLFRKNRADQPIPHLIIIADEFAELKREQPEFIKELVSASRIGRSLGVHLILATQKPSGVVDDEIWGNSRFHLCLKVQDKQDSNDMLKRTEAAYITNVGRGFMQVGNNEIFEEFQSAWSGAPYDKNEDIKGNKFNVSLLDNSGYVLTSKKKKEKQDFPSQLDYIVSHIYNVFQENNITPLKPIWLPPLKHNIGLNEINATLEKDKSLFTVGLVDDPINQTQLPLNISLIDAGNMIIAGGIGSGKTTLIKTLIYSLISNNSADTLHMYIADYGSRVLNIFNKAPNVGAVIFEGQEDRLQKTIRVLKKMLDERKTKLSEKGIATFKEYYKKNKECPLVVFVIDNVANLLTNNPNIEDDLFILSREGLSYGIYIIMSCTDYHSEVKQRIKNNFSSNIGLQLPSYIDYEDVLQIKSRTMPDNGAGRGLIKTEHGCLELQVANIIDSDDSEKINEYITRTILSMEEAKNNKVIQIPSIPKDLTFDNFINSKDVFELLDSNRYLPIGYDIDEMELVNIDLANSYCLSIPGASQSGKTNLLKLITKEKCNCSDVYLISSSEEIKWEFEQIGIKGIISTSDELYDFLNEVITSEMRKRDEFYHDYHKNKNNIDLDDYMDKLRPIFILIDDMSLFIDMVYNSKTNIEEFLMLCLKKGRMHGIYFVAAISQSDYNHCVFKPLFKNFIAQKEGMHFGGMVEQPKIFDFNMNFSEANKRLASGTAYLNKDGRVVRLITPKVDS